MFFRTVFIVLMVILGAAALAKSAEPAELPKDKTCLSLDKFKASNKEHGAIILFADADSEDDELVAVFVFPDMSGGSVHIYPEHKMVCIFDTYSTIQFNKEYMK